ncbi:MAG: hypothetical protein IPP83_06135 [Flavobacteriales bacterium]|nr:hypothetical protein [Flavobacteriales bacterium]
MDRSTPEGSQHVALNAPIVHSTPEGSQQLHPGSEIRSTCTWIGIDLNPSLSYSVGKISPGGIKQGPTITESVAVAGPHATEFTK